MDIDNANNNRKPPKQDVKRAAFMSRDGVVNVPRGDIFRWEEFDYLPGSLEALRLLTSDPETLVVVTTHQPGIGQGKFSEADFQILTNKMHNDLLGQDIYVDGVWYCPHLPAPERAGAYDPYDQACTCYKPQTGMIDAAQEHFGEQGTRIDLANSCVFGGRPRDIKMASEIGCPGVLIETARPRWEPGEEQTVNPTHVAPDLLQAVKWWLGQ